MRLIANRQLRGDYGVVAPGQQFETTDAIAMQLLNAGLVRKAAPPQVLYETKPVYPAEAPEVRPERPFRDMSMPDPQPANVAPAGDSVLPEPDVQPAGDADPVRRRRRSRFDSGAG